MFHNQMIPKYSQRLNFIYRIVQVYIFHMSTHYHYIKITQWWCALSACTCVIQCLSSPFDQSHRNLQAHSPYNSLILSLTHYHRVFNFMGLNFHRQHCLDIFKSLYFHGTLHLTILIFWLVNGVYTSVAFQWFKVTTYTRRYGRLPTDRHFIVNEEQHSTNFSMLIHILVNSCFTMFIAISGRRL